MTSHKTPPHSHKTPPRSPHTRPCHPNCNPVATSQDPSPQWPGCASVSAWDRHLQAVHHSLKQAIIRRARWPTNDCSECPTYAAAGGIPPTNLAHDIMMDAYRNNHSATANRVQKQLPKEPNQVTPMPRHRPPNILGGPRLQDLLSRLDHLLPTTREERLRHTRRLRWGRASTRLHH